MQKITTPQKTLMRCLFPIVFTMLMAGQAWAGPEEDALAAYLRKDYAQVLKIVKPPAIKGEAWAQGWLADAYNNGEGVAQDYAEAVKWYRLAAEQGRANDQFNLGVMYDNGQGVVQNYAEAVKWYRLSAQQGDAFAQYFLGYMYVSGEGVLKEYVKAHSWYNLAAVDSRHPNAANAANAANSRDSLAKHMTPQQIADAQKLAGDCQARQFKGCD
jgi:TPR repeat protein